MRSYTFAPLGRRLTLTFLPRVSLRLPWTFDCKLSAMYSLGILADASDKVERSPSSDKVERSPSSDKVERYPSSDKVECSPSSDKVERYPSSDKVERYPSSDKIEGFPPPGVYMGLHSSHWSRHSKFRKSLFFCVVGGLWRPARFPGVMGAVERMSADRNRCGRRSNQRNHYGQKSNQSISQSVSRPACGCVWLPGFVALLWCVG